MASNPNSEEGLNKMLVAQLRSMCKEKRITGYSKLTKSAIIAKLLDWQKQNGPLVDGAAQTSPSSGLKSRQPEAQEVPTALSINEHRSNDRDTESERCLPPSKSSAVAYSDALVQIVNGLSTPLPSLRQSPNNTGTASQGKVVSETHTDASDTPEEATPVIPQKRRHDADGSEIKPVGKKSKILQKPIVVSSPRQGTPSVQSGLAEKRQNILAQRSNNVENISVAGAPPKRNRFKTLVPDSGKKIAVTTVPRIKITEPSRLKYLDLGPAKAIPQMQRITLPPSVSQRKHVSRLSILLGSISLQDLKACTMVSRLFRYSAYFAAYQQLLRTFPGARLRNVLSAYPSNVTNFWPYLSYRIDEVVERKSTYEASFLGRTVKGIYTISDNLWTSPDDPKQITIAVRFLLTRVFFWISLGLGDDMTQPQNSRYKVILEAQEVVPQEIWKVTVQSDFTLITYYVLEDTCEVIGEQIADGISPVTDFRNLRIDWSTYIASRRYLPPQSVNKDNFGLLEHLQWSNHEEYNRGISKVWLSRVEREGDIGSAKLEVARRYVLACVVSNSVSGPRLTSNQMQQEFDGLSNIRDSVAIKSDRINMFLPA